MGNIRVVQMKSSKINTFQLNPIMKTILILIILGFSATISYSQSQKTIDSLVQSLETEKAVKNKTETLIELSSLFMSIDPSQGLEYANSAIELAKSLDQKLLLAKAYNFQGGNWLYLSEDDNALKSFMIAKNLYAELGQTSKAGEIIGNIGHLRAQQGDFTNALKSQYEALKLLDPQVDSASINNTYMAIGDIFMQLGKYTEALKHDSIALKGYFLNKDEYGIALCKGNMANIYSNQGKTDIAKKYYLEAISIYERINSPFDLVRELSNLSTLYEQEGNLIEAISLTERALNLSEKNDFLLGYGMSSGNMGSYYLTAIEKNKNNNNTLSLPSIPNAQLIDSAIYYLEQCISIGVDVNGAALTAWATENLSRVQVENGQMKEAYYNYKYAVELKDSIYSQETKKEIETLITEREIAVKNKQIELDKLAVLKKRNERLYFGIGLVLLFLLLVAIYWNYKNQKSSNIKLLSTNTDLSSTLTKLQETQEQLIQVERQKEKALIRTRISQDIHDDISSDLTKISWLSELIQTKVQKDTTTDLSELAKKINASSNETVSKLGEIIWSTNPKADNLDSLLAYMRSHLNSFFEDSDITCTINFPKGTLNQKVNTELRRNLFLIMKESVNNAFKYSKATAIQIDFTVNEGHYELQIQDNGVGFKPGESQGSGNGMKNMLARINKVNGTLQINSIPHKSTTVICRGLIFA